MNTVLSGPAPSVFMDSGLRRNDEEGYPNTLENNKIFSFDP